MPGRIFRRVLGVFLVTSALLCIPFTASAASPDSDATSQGSWNPISFLLHYVSSLLPGGFAGDSDMTSSPKPAESCGGTSSAGEGGGGATGTEDDGDNGAGIDPDGTP